MSEVRKLLKVGLIAFLVIAWIVASGPIIGQLVPGMESLGLLAYLWIPLCFIIMIAGPVVLIVYLVRRK